MEQLTNVINEQGEVEGKIMEIGLPNDPNIKPERVLNPIPIPFKGISNIGLPTMGKPYMTKNQFIRWAKSNGVGCRYQGSTQTMYIFGENAEKIADMAKMATYFKIVVQND